MHTTHARIRYTYVWSGTIIMALYKYFERGPALPTLRTCGEQANAEALGESSTEPTGNKADTPQGKRKGTGREVRCWERFVQGG